MVALDALTALSLEQQQKDVYTTPDQLSEELVTLTLLPRSKWQTLLNLETITVCFTPLGWSYIASHLSSYNILPLHYGFNSNGTNLKKHLKYPRRLPFSFLPCRASNNDSWSTEIVTKAKSPPRSLAERRKRVTVTPVIAQKAISNAVYLTKMIQVIVSFVP